MRARRRKKPKPPPMTGGTFDTYEAAAAAAQTRADAHGYDYGIEPVGGTTERRRWRVMLLPQRWNRLGSETRCEVRMCSDLERCKPGHGPMAPSESARENSP